LAYFQKPLGNVARKQCFMVCPPSGSMAKKQCFLVYSPSGNMARKQCFLVCPPSGNMARKQCFLVLHLWETWLGNNVSWFSTYILHLPGMAQCCIFWSNNIKSCGCKVFRVYQIKQETTKKRRKLIVCMISGHYWQLG
jgi:hypothetical protein